MRLCLIKFLSHLPAHIKLVKTTKSERLAPTSSLVDTGSVMILRQVDRSVKTVEKEVQPLPEKKSTPKSETSEKKSTS